jgi:PPE family
MWPFDREIPGEAHAAFDHKTVYDQLQNGSGPSSLSTAVASWQSNIGSEFDDAHQLITSGLKKAAAIWEGSAAESFHGDVTPMAQFVLDAKDVSHAVGQSTQDQASHFTDVRSKIPPPVKVDATDSMLSRGWAHLTGGKTDAEVQEQQAMDASDSAAGVYSDYRNNSTTATTTVSSYPVVPQSNGIDAAPPQQTGGPVPYNPGDPGHTGTGGMQYAPHSTPTPGPVNRTPMEAPHNQPPEYRYPVADPPPSTDLQHDPVRLPIGSPPIGGPPWGQPPISPPGGGPVLGPIGGPPYGPIGSGGTDGSGSSGGGRRGGSSSAVGPRGSGGAGSAGNTSGRGAGAGAVEAGGPGGRAAGAAGKPGAAGGSGLGAGAGRGKGKGEDDVEHTNKFMEPTDEHWGTGEKTVPTVIGEPGYEG